VVVRILRLTTGRVLQSYRSRHSDGFENWHVWEDNQHVLASGSARNGGFTQAVLRLSTTGTAERISPFRRFDRRIMPIPET
jgi:hypothetical protein